ncbi:MAG: hypothetical protein LC722_01355 [Actinobacteria bacterium]|nr:hypothetical protein [Actinomycetota bacterium]
MSDRTRAGIALAGTSTFLSVMVAAALLLSLGVLSQRLGAPALPGDSQVTIALPALIDTTAPPASGPGSIPAAPTRPGRAGEGGGAAAGPVPQRPGTQETPPAVGARVGSDDVAGLGVLGVDLPPVRLGSASGGTHTTHVELLGVDVEVETSDHLVNDVLCLLICG